MKNARFRTVWGVSHDAKPSAAKRITAALLAAVLIAAGAGAYAFLNAGSALTGTACAVLDSSGNMTFFRSTGAYNRRV